MTPRPRRIEPDFLLPLLFAALLNAPYLAANVVPVHDTFYNFSNFQIFYSEFFLRGELVQWYPYGAFGLPADYQQLISLTPFDYLVGLAGALLRVRDALLLFKLSAIAEQMVFALGAWLLARRLFASRATALAVGIAAAGSVVWYAQQWFELRFFYLLPLLLFFFTTFLAVGRAEWLWLTGLTAVAWAIGNVPYFVPIWAFVLAIVAAAPAFAERRPWLRVFEPRATNWLLLGAFLGSAGAFAYLAFHSIDYLAMPDLGRDPRTGLVTLETFRTWGGNADLRVVARSALTGWPLQLPWGSGADNSFYFGLLPLLGLVLALARERSRWFVGFAAAIAALVWLSLGGVFATLVYYLPGMAQYRHVGLVYGLTKALCVLASGYGLERLWHWRPPPLPPRVLWIAAAVVLVAAALAAARAFAGGAAWSSAWDAQVALRIAAYLGFALLSLAATRSLAPGLVLALAIDLAIYQAAVYDLRAPKLAPYYAAKLDAFDVAPATFQPQRAQHPAPKAADPRPRDVLELAKHPGSMEVYWITYQLAAFDPCHSEFWNELSTYGVDLLTRLERRRARDFAEIIGCGAPKLRLVAGAKVVSDLRAARDAFVAAADDPAIARDVIRVGPGVEVSPSDGEPGSSAGTVEVTHFTPSELVAKVHADAPHGAWLLYADAMYPGWHATVDGKPAPIGEANLAFKAVRVPAGDSVVRFWFRRGLSFYATWFIAIFGLAFALGVLALPFLAAARQERG